MKGLNHWILWIIIVLDTIALYMGYLLINEIHASMALILGILVGIKIYDLILILLEKEPNESTRSS